MTNDQLIAERQRIGSAIKARREALSMTQKEIAERAGLQQQNIHRIELGRYSVGLDIINRVLEALGLKLDIKKVRD